MVIRSTVFLRFLRSNAIAVLALFIALGGSAWAASKVGSGDIKTNAVKTRHVANSQIGGAELKPGAVGRRELAPGSRSLSFTDSPQSIGSSFTDVTFNQFQNTDGSPLQPAETLVVVEESGFYALDGEIHWAIDGTGDRKLRIIVTDPGGGTARVIASDRRPAADAFTTGNVSATDSIVAGSTISLQASQSSATPLPTEDFDGYSARLSVQYIAPTGV